MIIVHATSFLDAQCGYYITLLCYLFKVYVFNVLLDMQLVCICLSEDTREDCYNDSMCYI